MEFKEGLLAAQRMCKAHVGCYGCKSAVEACPFPYLDEKWDVDMAVKAVEDWAATHRPKTRLDVLKERFPFAPVYEDTCLPMSCPKAYFGKDISKACEGLKRVTDTDICNKCWNRPAPEMYQPKEDEP